MITFKIEQMNAEKPQDFQSQHARFKVLKPLAIFTHSQKPQNAPINTVLSYVKQTNWTGGAVKYTFRVSFGIC